MKRAVFWGISLIKVHVVDIHNGNNKSEINLLCLALLPGRLPHNSHPIYSAQILKGMKRYPYTII